MRCEGEAKGVGEKRETCVDKHMNLVQNEGERNAILKHLRMLGQRFVVLVVWDLFNSTLAYNV